MSIEYRMLKDRGTMDVEFGISYRGLGTVDDFQLVTWDLVEIKSEEEVIYAFGLWNKKDIVPEELFRLD